MFWHWSGAIRWKIELTRKLLIKRMKLAILPKQLNQILYFLIGNYRFGYGTLKNVVIGFLGTQKDVGKNRKWKPTRSLVQHDDFHVDRLELLYDAKFERLAGYVKAEIEQLSPETEVMLVNIDLDDPWDFQEVLTIEGLILMS